jgi:uncharacterized membrane protein HdeD (DUF308 family)
MSEQQRVTGATAPVADPEKLWPPMAFRAALALSFGFAALLWPDITVLALAILAGAWLLVGGVVEIVTAIRLRQRIRWSWAYVLGGLLSIAAGLLLALWPQSGAVALAILLGVFALLFGAIQLGLAWRIRSEAGSHLR